MSEISGFQLPAHQFVTAGLDFNLGVPVGKPGAVDERVQAQLIGRAGDGAVDGCLVAFKIDVKAVAARIFPVGFEAAEKAGLLDVGAAVFGAKHVAVSAIVAGVGVVGQLMRFRHLENAPRHALRRSLRREFEVVVGNVHRRSLVNEIGNVGANGHALVTVDAVVKPELGADLARHALVVLPRVTRIFRRLLDEDGSVEHARRVHQSLLEAGDASRAARPPWRLVGNIAMRSCAIKSGGNLLADVA